MRGFAVTIKAVFRVQCDGPCRGWLSWREEYTPGTDMQPGDHVIEPTAVRALNWPGERTARVAALDLGWEYQGRDRYNAGKLLCPGCRESMLDALRTRIPGAAPCLGTHDTWTICRECAG